MKSEISLFRLLCAISFLLIVSVLFESCESCSRSGRAKLAKERNQKYYENNRSDDEESKDIIKSERVTEEKPSDFKKEGNHRIRVQVFFQKAPYQ